MRRYVPRSVRARLLIVSLVIMAGAVTTTACTNRDTTGESSAAH